MPLCRASSALPIEVWRNACRLAARRYQVVVVVLVWREERKGAGSDVSFQDSEEREGGARVQPARTTANYALTHPAVPPTPRLTTRSRIAPPLSTSAVHPIACALHGQL